MPVSSNERPLETTTIRLRRDAGMCVAPWYVGEELLREGFTDIRHVPVRAVLQQRQIIGRGDRFFFAGRSSFAWIVVFRSRQ
jgi:NitT/TauT family transport system substrate-binding protein